MNREILKRGLLPHYRLGEILGGFVNPISQIRSYLEKNEDESFIDLSQLLGARIIIGNEEMRAVVNDRIIDPFIFKRKGSYIRRMIAEIYNRQHTVSGWVNGTCSLKDIRGGLRDMEAIALMLKAEFGCTIPVSEEFFTQISPLLPEFGDILKDLTKSLIFLRTVRNLYRLIVSAEDKIQKEYLHSLLNIFRQNPETDLTSGEAIVEQIQNSLDRSSRACDKIIAYLAAQNKY
jgi:UTP:GlnB (protein PII) uridylyltransferase